VKEKVFFTTNERKQMSTKTLFKRISLTTVVALGFGLLSGIAPANAVSATAISLDTPSITVVSSDSTESQTAAVIRISVTDENGDAYNLASGETVSISLLASGLPTDVAGDNFTPLTSDFAFLDVENFGTWSKDTNTAINQTLSNLTDAAVSVNSTNCGRTGDANHKGDYCFGIMSKQKSGSAEQYPNVNASDRPAMSGGIAKYADKGTYTFTVDLKDATSVLARTTFKFKVVSSANDSGAVITLAKGGSITKGSAYTLSGSTTYLRATLRDANGGRITGSETNTDLPAPAAELLQGDPLAVTDRFVVSDTGTANYDYGSSTSVLYGDGVYGISGPSSSYGNGAGTIAASANDTTTTLRVRYGTTITTLAANIVTAAKTAIPSASTRTVTATGVVASAETTTASGAVTYYLPTTTTTAKVKIVAKNAAGDVQSGQTINFYTTWANTGAGNVTPQSGVTYSTNVLTDAAGVAEYEVTQSVPQAGSTAVITISGASASASEFAAVTLSWPTPTISSITVTDPNANFKSTPAASVTVTATAKDQFGNAVGAGYVIQPSLSSTSANYSTTPMAQLTTDANGKVSVTLTGGASATSDALTFTHSATGVASSARTITYTTVPTVGYLGGSYSLSEAGTSYTNFSTTALGALDALDIDKTVNTSKAVAVTGTSTTNTQVKLRVFVGTSSSASATGVPVSVSMTDGAWVLDSCDGTTAKPVSSRICYPDSDGYIFVQTLITKPGLHTYTFTSGSKVITQQIAAENAATDARFVALTGLQDSMKVTVTDRFGNAVSGVNVQVSVTGATLGGGAPTSTFTTLADGTVPFSLVASAAGNASVTALITTAGTDASSVASYSGANLIDSTVAAGKSSVTSTVPVTTTGNTSLAAQAAAEAATDAANEAIDAANAATDAANLAAEAADAATVAAEEARDAADAATAAVEELASQVATLMAALKAQITTLANTVAKIAKKVKA